MPADSPVSSPCANSTTSAFRIAIGLITKSSEGAPLPGHASTESPSESPAVPALHTPPSHLKRDVPAPRELPRSPSPVEADNVGVGTGRLAEQQLGAGRTAARRRRRWKCCCIPLAAVTKFGLGHALFDSTPRVWDGAFSLAPRWYAVFGGTVPGVRWLDLTGPTLSRAVIRALRPALARDAGPCPDSSAGSARCRLGDIAAAHAFASAPSESRRRISFTSLNWTARGMSIAPSYGGSVSPPSRTSRRRRIRR
jgi:hypothetical protein